MDAAYSIDRKLSLAAFLYEMPLQTKPTQSDYKDLSMITESILHDIFDWFFDDVNDVSYGSSKVNGCEIMAPFLIKCDVSLFFSDDGLLPDAAQLDEIATQELKKGSNFHQLYLERLHESDQFAFSKATDVLYISSEVELSAAVADIQEYEQSTKSNNEADSSSTLSKVVIPVASIVFLGLLTFAGYIRFQQHKKNSDPFFDRNENIMKHAEYDRDMEDGTYKTDSYSQSDKEDATVMAYEAFRAYKEKGNLDKHMDQMIQDLEEVASVGSSTSYTSERIDDDDEGDEDEEDCNMNDQAESLSVAATLVAPSKAFHLANASDDTKPAWARRYLAPSSMDLRSGNTVVDSQHSSTPIISQLSESTRDTLSIPVLEVDKYYDEVEEASIWTEESIEEDVKPVPEVSQFDDEESPIAEKTPKEEDFTKVRLRSKVEVSAENEKDTKSSEPEWLVKYKQMGLDKKEFRLSMKNKQDLDKAL